MIGGNRYERLYDGCSSFALYSYSCCALFALRGKKKKETDGQTETAKSGSYMLEGMCIGMLLGLLIGSKFMTIGMLLGLLIGGSIKKKV